MRLSRLQIQGFGKLTDCEFVFEPSLNLVLGPNESGKSTLQQAILALLYGFYRDGRRTRRETALKNRLVPWARGCQYGASLEYSLDDGSKYRVERSFPGREQSARLLDLTYSRDVSGDYPRDRNGGLHFCETQIGMTKDLFVRTVFIEQGAIRDIGEGNELVTAIAAMLETGSTETTISQVIQQIDDTIREKIGRTPRAYTRPLAKARQALRECQDELGIISEARTEINHCCAERERRQAALRKSEAELQRLDLVIAQVDLGEIRERLDRLRGINAQLADLESVVQQTRAYAQFPIEQRDQLTQLYERRDTYVEVIERLEGQVHTEASQLEAAEAEWVHRQRRTKALTHVDGFPLHLRDDVTREEANWRASRSVVTDRRSALDSAVTRLRDLGAQLRGQQTIYRVRRSVGLEQFRRLREAWADSVSAVVECEAEVAQTSQALCALGASEDEIQRITSVRHSLTPEDERDLFERHTELAVLEERLAGAQVVSPSLQEERAPRAPWPILLVGAVTAGLSWFLLPVLGLQSLAPVVSVGFAAAALVLFVVLSLRRRPRRQDLKADDASAVRMLDKVQALRSEQRRALGQLGAASWDDLQTMLQRHSVLATPLAERAARVEMLGSATERESDAEGALLRVLVPMDVAAIDDALLENTERVLVRVEALLDEIRDSAEQKQAARSLLERAATRLADAEGRLEDLLLRAHPDDGSMEDRLTQFKQRCDEKRELEDCKVRLQTLDEQIKRLRSTRGRLRQSQESLGEAETAIRALLSESGVDCGDACDYEQARRRFEDCARNRRRYDDTQAEMASFKQQRASLLADRTPAALEREQRRLSQRCSDLLRKRPALGGVVADQDLGTLRQSRAALEEARRADENRVVELNERIRGRLDGLRPRAMVEEDVAYWEEQITRLESFRRSLDIAEEVLKEAADEHQREFAPILASGLGDNLRWLTDDRYGQVYVCSDDLAVSLRVPETEQVIDPSVLSYGTQEQIYILLRIAVAELMSGRGESVPVILDDPFVNLDTERLVRMMALLARLSSRYQIVLLSKDESLLDCFDDHGFDVNTIRMSPPEY